MLSPEAPILVTGGGGFIGGRIVEVLHDLEVPVRAAVRRWGSAARIGSLAVPIVQCDVRDPEQVSLAVAGTRAIVHCAYGDARTNIEGTRNVLEAAARARVSRIVHFSTMEVYGDVEGDVHEAVPMSMTGWEYADSKVEAERLCEAYGGSGLPIAILRPTLVYGPFSRNWTVGIAQRLLAGGSFPGGADAEGICNLVYVDDVVLACLMALRREEAPGEAFNVNGSERVTWSQYLKAFGRALGLDSDQEAGPWRARLRSVAMAPVRASASWALDRFEEPIMNVYKRYPLAQRLMQRTEAAIRSTPSSGEFRLFGRQAYFPIDKARRLLDFEPQVSLADGMELSIAWLRHHGFLGPPPPETLISRASPSPAT